MATCCSACQTKYKHPTSREVCTFASCLPGGLIDDCIVTNAGDHLYLVINAGHEDKDLVHIQKYMAEFKAKGGDVSLEVVEGGGLLALQGPKAVDVMTRLCPDVDFSKIKFMSGHKMKVGGFECFVTRSGYTGEDGFEMGVKREDTVALASMLLEQPEVCCLYCRCRLGTTQVCTAHESCCFTRQVLAVGLGARDSLRLEAGLCLYGNDLDDTTTPSEAVLVWTIGARRKQEGGFVGSDKILGQIKDKSATRKRVGFTSTGPSAREGSPIFTKEGEKVGNVTSGVVSPCLKQPIGMAYVGKGFAKAGVGLPVFVWKGTEAYQKG